MGHKTIQNTFNIIKNTLDNNINPTIIALIAFYLFSSIIPQEFSLVKFYFFFFLSNPSFSIA